ncbi:MAG TPA: HAD family hydrolase [Chitinolyticbacter sp.]|nr:HAD family hydrolase [Chitinolyticbacter sp.]
MTPADIDTILFDWGGTLMSEAGPETISMAWWPTVAAIAGAQETLAALASRYRIAVATNASVSRRPEIEHALQRVDLLRHVAAVFCYTELGVKKDDARFWSAVTSALQVPAERLLMVGDVLEQDVLAPRRSGLAAIWFNPAAAPVPDGVPSVTALPQLLPLLLAPA